MVGRGIAVAIAVSGVLALGGCETLGKHPYKPKPSVSVEPPSPSDKWIGLANPDDRDRIARVEAAWTAALADARAGGAADDISKEGLLLKPAAALPRPAPTPGSYNCRLVKVGNYTRKTKAFERFKPFFCYVEVDGDELTIVKQTGSQRPAGRLYADDRADRLVYLGSLALGSEDQPLAYGESSARNMAGVFQRIGAFQWRLVIPWPRSQSKLDVFELTPVAEQPK
ncbi:DUF4893 domain-containing protein [Sphingomonas ginkgonis]|nr:DUF4893 domain-containing protein [Sphingomonas ginkgonis]